MGLGIGEWVNGYFVTITTSPERIYVRVRKYKAGASVEQPPDFDKTVLLDNNEHKRHALRLRSEIANSYRRIRGDRTAINKYAEKIGGYELKIERR